MPFSFLEKISVVKFFDNHSANTAVTLGLLLTAYEVIDTLFLGMMKRMKLSAL